MCMTHKWIVCWKHYLKMNQSSFVCLQLDCFKYCFSVLIILFNVIGFKSNKWLKSAIKLIDGILTDTTTSGQSGPDSNGMKGYSTFPKAVYGHIRTLIEGGDLTPFQRCSQHILQPPADWAVVFKRTSSKKKSLRNKTVNMNIQWIQFPNL